MSDNTNESIIVTPVGVLSFPALFSPKKIDEDKDAVYQCNLIFDEKAQDTEAWKKMVDAMVKAAQDKFGQDVNLKRLKMPIKGNDFMDYGGYEDDNGKFLRCKSKRKPGVVDMDRQDVFDANAVYPGCLCRLSLNVYAYDHPRGGKGVGFGLRNVQVVNNDETQFPRLDGMVSADEEFGRAEALPSDIPVSVTQQEPSEVFGGDSGPNGAASEDPNELLL